ncbi:MAG TPA: hypothetical protein VL094_08285 [Sphingomonadaceae bacterium]|nr:hypothetical protein [Sphingomonadaceae bacterium]
MRKLPTALLAILLIAAPLSAKDSLGVFSDWGAFRDGAVPRCYAIAMALNAAAAKDHQPFASVGTWPRRQLRNQIHFRLSRNISPAGKIMLTVGRGTVFELTGGGGDAWAQDRRMDAAIVAAMRSAGGMIITARDTAGASFSDRYSLTGAATAMDAATVGCAKLR